MKVITKINSYQKPGSNGSDPVTRQASISQSSLKSESNLALNYLESDKQLDKMIEIIQKPRKSKYEQKILFQTFEKTDILSGIQDLDKQTDNNKKELYSYFSYEKRQEREVLFQIGDIGRKFYVILKGEVYILLQKQGFAETSAKKHISPIKIRQESNQKQKYNVLFNKNCLKNVAQYSLKQQDFFSSKQQ